jgi:hypothetical protein
MAAELAMAGPRFVSLVIEPIAAAARGPHLPIVYNPSAYDSPASLRCPQAARAAR